MSMPIVLPTPGFAGHGVQFSPFDERRVAIAGGQHFGIVGNGRLFVAAVDPVVGAQVLSVYDSQEGLYDVAWSENNNNQLVCGSADGSVRLIDTTLPNFPVKIFQEHQREVHGVHWNLVRKDCFVSASWDGSIKLWMPDAPNSLMTFAEHTHCVYNAIWCPHRADVIASASGDRSVRIWDVKQPRSIQSFIAHDAEVLSLDWNKYRENEIATASVDKTIRLWDLRMPNRVMLTLAGHRYAIRRLKYSPHKGNILGTVSYDMTACIWNIDNANDPLVFMYDRHTEFACGIDFNLYVPGQVATTSWDETTHFLQIPNIA